MPDLKYTLLLLFLDGVVFDQATDKGFAKVGGMVFCRTVLPVYFSFLKILLKVDTMVKVSTNINLDPVLKQDAQSLLKDLGIDLTTVVTIFLRQTDREQ